VTVGQPYVVDVSATVDKTLVPGTFTVTAFGTIVVGGPFDFTAPDQSCHFSQFHPDTRFQL
jgi:hypothetical protein